MIEYSLLLQYSRFDLHCSIKVWISFSVLIIYPFGLRWQVCVCSVDLCVPLVSEACLGGEVGAEDTILSFPSAICHNHFVCGQPMSDITGVVGVFLFLHF